MCFFKSHLYLEELLKQNKTMSKINSKIIKLKKTKTYKYKTDLTTKAMFCSVMIGT